MFTHFYQRRLTLISVQVTFYPFLILRIKESLIKRKGRLKPRLKSIRIDRNGHQISKQFWTPGSSEGGGRWGSNTDSILFLCITVAVYGQERVVRGCGYITDEMDNGECLMRSGTHDVRAIYCSCTSDFCNSVESLRTPSLLPLASLLTAVLATPKLLLSCPIAPPRLSLSRRPNSG